MLFSPLPQTYPCAGCQEAIIVNKVRGDNEANMGNNAFSMCPYICVSMSTAMSC